MCVITTPTFITVIANDRRIKSADSADSSFFFSRPGLLKLNSDKFIVIALLGCFLEMLLVAQSNK